MARSSCAHDIVIREMCAECGQDLRDREEASLRASMGHRMPDLKVFDGLANKLAMKDRSNLLRRKKLVLLVDLDQTVIHTTNHPYNGCPQDDIFTYKLGNWSYTTKIRPHCKEFLENISQYYEMHVVTFGERSYADVIVSHIDPEKKYFGDRILSRDELIHKHKKTENLKLLFPCGEELIAIIDDRKDVWEDMDNLVHVKPYKFFKEVGDINAPGVKQPLVADYRGAGQTENNPQDDDRFLEMTERILIDAHERFYSHYEETCEIPDMKDIIAEMRREVLAGVKVVLSGIVPQGEDPRRSSIYQHLRRFGAIVQGRVSSETTVVIGRQWGTQKIHEAHRRAIPVVDTKWIGQAAKQWSMPAFDDFALPRKRTSREIADRNGSCEKPLFKEFVEKRIKIW
ncbi:hypothetical protein QR680_007957 [Steinernema hermaphroditum]|uniref:RNA polymerase II subunit A C-terminal domain phosphatase n=1 Tax=Steinernema hermaphroditum TaxID=289476 RepID=A0AA39IET2_9BILA|nr:hypothetical protein QR680_007957 [Steinernema hermaphroditum]